jgi:hypothetical protein
VVVWLFDCLVVWLCALTVVCCVMAIIRPSYDHHMTTDQPNQPAIPTYQHNMYTPNRAATSEPTHAIGVHVGSGNIVDGVDGVDGGGVDDIGLNLHNFEMLHVAARHHVCL